jgi:hypothetical protein
MFTMLSTIINDLNQNTKILILKESKLRAQYFP